MTKPQRLKTLDTHIIDLEKQSSDAGRQVIQIQTDISDVRTDLSDLINNSGSIGAFSAYRNSALSLATTAIVTYDSEEFDISGWFNTSNGRYTPLLPGYYRVSWSVRKNASFSDATKFWQAILMKNGGALKVGSVDQGSTATNPMSLGTAIILANGSTDYFEVSLQHNETGSVALLTNSQQTYFQGEFIGPS